MAYPTAPEAAGQRTLPVYLRFQNSSSERGLPQGARRRLASRRSEVCLRWDAAPGEVREECLGRQGPRIRPLRRSSTRSLQAARHSPVECCDCDRCQPARNERLPMGSHPPIGVTTGERSLTRHQLGQRRRRRQEAGVERELDGAAS